MVATVAHLQAGEARATIGARGAELLSLTFGGREMIWPGDAGLWPRQAPLLFPFCGWVTNGRYRAKGREFTTSAHGFGPNAIFSISQPDADRAQLALTDSEETRAEFPFAFRLDVEVVLTPDAISFTARIANPAQETLPYAIGFHPGFRWPFAGGRREDYSIEFAQPETGISPVIVPRGLFSPARFAPPVEGRAFDLMAALAAADSTVILDAANDTLAFTAPGGETISVRKTNLPHWVFWSLPPAPFVCIEGWSGQGDPVDFSGDIFDKPGMIHLAPGETGEHRYDIAFRPALA